METLILNLVVDFFNQDLNSKIPKYYLRDKFINIGNLTINEVEKIFQEKKDNNPIFGVCDILGVIFPSVNYEEYERLTEEEKLNALIYYINSNIFLYVSKRLPSFIKRTPLSINGLKEMSDKTYYTCYIEKDFDTIVKKLSCFFKFEPSKRFHLIRNIEDNTTFEWSIEQILQEINRDHSNDFTPYTNEDYLDGWNEWVEGKGSYEIVDLLSEYHLLPQNIADIINSHNEENDLYEECSRIVKELNANNYDANYGLDGILYSLVRIE